MMHFLSKFEWDETKNQANIHKHGLSFTTATKIFDHPVCTVLDNRENYGEDRYITLGTVNGVIVLVVVHTDRNGKTRIISARPTSQKERNRYYDQIQQRT